MKQNQTTTKGFFLFIIGALLLGFQALAQTTSKSTWQTIPMSQQTGIFRATFNAVPHQNGMDGVTGILTGTAAQWSDLACVVRFNPSGQIDARNGGAYAADATVNYSAGTIYFIRMEIDVPSKTYSVFVKPQDLPEVTLALNYAFRSEQSTVTSLDGWALHGFVGTHTIGNMQWSASTTDTSPPTTPGNLTATAVSSGQIDIQWQASADNVGVAGYDIYRDGQYIQTATTTTYSDLGLTANTTYSYTVRAFDAAFNLSAQSNAAQAKTQTAPSNVFLGNSVSRTSAGITFTWTFNCGGKQCTYGQFVTGDYWVVPIDQNGVNHGSVTITGITPNGEQHGAQVNPTIDVNRTNNKQGLMNMYGSYSKALNVMTMLPYQAKPGQSIAKIASRTTDCGPTASAPGCVSTGNILTILNTIPPNGGATVFRPPFHGNWKPLYTTDKVRFERLPKLPRLGNGTAPVGGAEGYQAWVVPQYGLAHGPYGFEQEFYRTMSPSLVMNNYAANQAQQYLDNMLRVFGNESNANKAAAVYTLMQKGIDNYGVFKMGVRFSSGAGQHLGKAPAVAFFAAMYDDAVVLNEIKAIAKDPKYVGFFQEYTQIRRGPTGAVVWGDGYTDLGENERRYWAGHFGEYKARVRGIGGYDNNGANSDPYGYIDGPGPDTYG